MTAATICLCPSDCNCRHTDEPYFRQNVCGCKAHAEIGSRWYFGGHHWRVIEHTTRDGEPAVRLAGITTKAKRVDRLSVLLRHSERIER